MDDAPLLRVRDLVTTFRTDGAIVRAVDGVSFDVPRASTVALVGESGCGKSVTALSILRLVASPPGRITSGVVAAVVSTWRMRCGACSSHVSVRWTL